MAHWQAGMVPSWTAKSPEWAPPGLGTSKSVQKGMLMKFVPSGAVLGVWGGQAGKVKTKTFKTFAPKLCPLHPRSPKLGCPNKNFCLASLLSFRADGRLAGSGRLAKVSGRGLPRVGQGSRCGVYRKTGKPRGLRPMNGASPKKPIG
eukprot:1148985-Pelagomonas_calceolata.AAC.3